MVDMEKSRRALKIFGLVVLFSVGDIFCDKVVFVETGKNHTFKPPRRSGTLETILWKFQKNKVVEFENNEETWYRLKGQADLNKTNGDFTIKQLRKEDSGLYESEIQVKSTLENSKHEIKVIDRITELTVTCEKPVEGKGNMLRCLPSPHVQANFTWSGPNGFKGSGQTITILEEPGPDIFYYCTAKNELGEKSTQFKFQDCVKGGGLSGGIIAAIVFACIIPVIAVLFVVYRKFIRNNDHVLVSRK
ncbi:hypothetical protein MHYP_G00068320 [Metynnis hypsauchen]